VIDDLAPVLRPSDLDPAQPVPPGWAVVDVREPVEWAAGRIPGSLHVPLAELPARLGDLPEGDLLIVCRSGNRSDRAARWLLVNGYDATNLAGGLVAWAGAGLPLTADAGRPPRVL
jgi:rhodanese-related sulfurtransferase